jgi:hypothetical protein
MRSFVTHAALPFNDPGVQSEERHNHRWNSTKIMRRAAINDKRNYHFSMVNGHLSFDRCKPLAG